MQHSSNGAFGETDRENHLEGHHWQILQSTKDLHEQDSMLSQIVMDKVLAETEHTLKISVTRERQQRWLANQRNANQNLEAMQITTADGEPSTIAWAKQLRGLQPIQQLKELLKR